MTRTRWIIVDKDGDPIGRGLIKPGKDIPVQMKSVKIDDFGKMTITVEYLHGGETE